jgi:hypothetical protein
MAKQLLFFVVIIFLLSSCSRFSTPAGAPLQVSSSTSYTGRTGPNSSGYSTTYYIKKNGGERLKLNGKNLIKLVSDNEKALAQARAYKVTKNVAVTSFLTMFSGLTYGFFIAKENSKDAQIAKRIGFLSIPVFIVSVPLGSSFAKKSIKTYNMGF